MNMNKNTIITALAILLVVGSIWGSIGNRQKADFKRELLAQQKELAALKEQSGSSQDAILGKAADLQGAMAALEAERNSAREELARQQAVVKDLETRLSLCLGGEISKASSETKHAANEPAETTPGPEATVSDQATVQIAKELELAKAQVTGLEKIIEEKNSTANEINKELDQFKINMDVLLAKIAEQQDSVQELQEENRELVKELTQKNQELADMKEQLLQTPVKK